MNDNVGVGEKGERKSDGWGVWRERYWWGICGDD